MQIKEKLLSLDKFENNEYLDFYCTLIINNTNTAKIKYKTQLHHSVPCLFYSTRKDADIDIDNIKVNLSYADHILAHYYLCLASKKDTIEYFKLLSAFVYMTNQKTHLHKNQYTTFLLEFNSYNLESQQELYEEYTYRLAKFNSEINTGKVLSQEHRAKIAASNTGKHISESRKKHLSEINTGKQHTEETKKKISESHIGLLANHRWMKKDGKTISVTQEEAINYLENGWEFGKATPDSRRIKIRCIETGEIFDSCQAADKKYHCYTRRAIINGSLAGGYHWEKVPRETNK